MKRGYLIAVILFIILLIPAVYFSFFFTYKCDNLSCFKSHQIECSKTQYVRDGEEATWLYEIKGKSDNKCEVYVEMLQVKKGDLDKVRLNKKSMNCFLKIGSIEMPESDLENCHGELKEELQVMIIQRLHTHVVENLEEMRAIIGAA